MDKISELQKLLLKEKEVGQSYKIDKITDKIYLGSKEGLNETDYLKKENINNVLSVFDIEPLNNNINHKIIKLGDLYCENIIKYFKECIEFIEQSDKIFIHCECGISRSSAIVIAYLMYKYKLNLKDAYLYIKRIRPEIDPNNGFRKQLNIFNDELIKNDYDLNKINFDIIKI